MNKSLIKFITDFGPLLVFFTIYYKSGKNIQVAILPFIVATIISLAVVYLLEKKIPLGNSGYIDFSEKRVLNTTLFSQYGNKMFLIIILLYIFLIFSFNRIL